MRSLCQQSKGKVMSDETDISKMIARVTAADSKVVPKEKTDVANDLFFPTSETAFTEVPVFRHRAISGLRN